MSEVCRNSCFFGEESWPPRLRRGARPETASLVCCISSTLSICICIVFPCSVLWCFAGLDRCVARVRRPARSSTVQPSGAFENVSHCMEASWCVFHRTCWLQYSLVLLCTLEQTGIQVLRVAFCLGFRVCVRCFLLHCTCNVNMSPVCTFELAFHFVDCVRM